MSCSSDSTCAVVSPRLTPEMVHALKINLIKAPCPFDQRPARKRKLKDPPVIAELPQWEVDGFWFAGFGDLIEDALKIPRSTCDKRPKTVLVTSDCGNMVARTTFGSLEISSHRRFLLKQIVPILAQSPPFLIYNYPRNLELLKARGQGAPELTEEQYCQGLLASMAARVLSNTLVQVLRPADWSDLSADGIAVVPGRKPVGFFVHNSLKVPSGGWAERHINHPNGTNAYEEVLDFNQLGMLNAFLLQVLELAPGPVKCNMGSVSSIRSSRSFGSQQ